MTETATNPGGGRRRARERIGADTARVWARELVLGNPYAKSILLALANYMNEDGSAYPGTATLARDTDISEETVVKRLRWLEAIGAIALFKCWRDENGRRNYDGRGKPTSSEIRFLFDADIDAIEQAAREAVEPKALRGAALASHSDRTSPRHGREQDSDQHLASPQVAPEQPPPRSDDSIEGNLESELEPPTPLAGGVREAIDQELEEDIEAFARDYPAPITDLPRLRSVLTAMERVTRRKVLLAVKGYRDYIEGLAKAGKPRAVKDAHRWVGGGQWQGYVAAGEKAYTASLVEHAAIDSEAGKALISLHRIARLGPPIVADGKVLLMQPLTPQALAVSRAPPESEWIFIPAEEFNRVRAWDDLLSVALKGKPRPELVTTRNRGGLKGFMAPWPWPPLKDGSISTGPPADHLSDAEAKEFTS